jgi:hypothetical protein
MKLDDLIAADQTVINLDPDVISVLIAFGFTSASYTLYSHTTLKYVGTIEGVRADGTKHTWIGTGTTPEEAEADALDALAKWILGQPIPPKTP